MVSLSGNIDDELGLEYMRQYFELHTRWGGVCAGGLLGRLLVGGCWMVGGGINEEDLVDTMRVFEIIYTFC